MERVLLAKWIYISIFAGSFGVAPKEKRRGEVLEWLKRHAWKVCKRQKRFAGSNPALSAKKGCKSASYAIYTLFYTQKYL